MDDLKEAVGCLFWLLVPLAVMGVLWCMSWLEANWP